MRRLLSTTAVFLTLVALHARAQFDSTVVNGAVIITDYEGPGGAVSIPTNINGLPVVSIADAAFYERYGVTGVTVPAGVTNIGDYAFYDCAKLTNITLPQTLLSIGNSTFEGCSALTSIAVPSSVGSIGNEAFGYCSNLGGVLLPGCLAGIGANEFLDCSSLTNVNIPGGVINIGAYAFSGCARLAGVNMPPNVANIGYGAFIGCSAIKTLTLPGKVANIGQYAFYNCTNLSGVYFSGNMPGSDSTAFANDGVTAFYLPGTSGWGDGLSGVPTTQWALPYPVILSSSMGIDQNNLFSFTVSWATNADVQIQASSDLANQNWTTISRMTLSNGSCCFQDAKWAPYHARFYRIAAGTP
jgi:hypothetical protein